jgi:hypothetical protein
MDVQDKTHTHHRLRQWNTHEKATSLAFHRKDFHLSFQLPFPLLFYRSLMIEIEEPMYFDPTF